MRPRPRRRAWITAAIVVLSVTLLGTAGWLVGFSSVLATSRVTVSGARVVDARQVRAVAAVPIGRPMVRQDVDRIAANVATLPPVRSVQVRRKWPKTIEIAVVERTPMLAVRQPTGLLLIDRSGVGYQTVSDLPDGVVLAEVNPTYQVLTVAVGEVAAALPPKLERRVEQIEASSTSDIALVLKSGVRVEWGSATDSTLKATITTALLKRSPRTIDVSAPHSPATT
jgi:cell division protein FtsQ